jgi:hypothetical protein
MTTVAEAVGQIGARKNSALLVEKTGGPWEWKARADSVASQKREQLLYTPYNNPIGSPGKMKGRKFINACIEMEMNK